ncbi:uncharacterized protein [Typha latifolia]|uniref:uncharacterized protein n=1 Tax=Typha latifolia TaxID=4733 RepID=UPI003C2E48A7
MPMIRYKIKNEYELGKPELSEAGDQDDPEAILEGVAMAGLVGLLRQLGDLAEFAAEIFHGLHEEVIGAAARGHGLIVRVQQLEAEFPSLDKGFLQKKYSKLSCNMGIDWHPNLKLDQNLITRGDMPRFIMESYKECHEPPQLFMLDKFDIAGAGACLKRFSDPSFFKTNLASSGMLQEDAHRERRVRRVMNTGPNSINAEISKSLTLSNFIPKLQNEISDQFSEEISVRRAKLKHRKLNQLETESFRKCMEHLLEMDSLEHRDLSTNHSNVTMESADSRESDTDIRDIVVDAALNMNHKPIQVSVKNNTACSLTNEVEKLKKESKDFSAILSGTSVEVPSYSTLSMIDHNSTFSEDEDKTEDSSADSPSSEVLSTPSTSRVYQTDHLPDCGSGTVGSTSGYISDDPPTEPDNYVDALTTMESEVETDTLINLRSNGSVGAAQESIDLDNVSDSPVKILHKKESCVDNESIRKSKNSVIPSEGNGNKVCQELTKSSDSLSGSLQHMAKMLLQMKHDDQHSQVVEQGIEYVGDSLQIPEVCANYVREEKTNPTEQEMEAGFIVQPEGATGEIDNSVAPLDNLATLKSEVGIKIGYKFSEGKSNDLEHKVEFQPSKSDNQQQELTKGSMHASNDYASISNILEDDLQIGNNDYASISNILEDDLQIGTPFDSTVTVGVISEAVENSHTICSPYASILNVQLQKQSACHGATDLLHTVECNPKSTTLLNEINTKYTLNPEKVQEVSAVTLSNSEPGTLSSSKPSETQSLDDISHINALQLEEADGHPNIGRSIPVDTSYIENNDGTKSFLNSSHQSSEEITPPTIFFPIKDSDPFEDSIEVQRGDAANALYFQKTGQHVNHSFQFSKAPSSEQKSDLHNYDDPVGERFPLDILESHNSFDSKSSLQTPGKIAMEDSKHLEPSDWQVENVSSCENMHIHCNPGDIVSKELEKEPGRDLHFVVNNSGNKELRVPSLDKAVHGQLVQIGYNSLESYAALCAGPDSHAIVSNREIDHVVVPPSNETKFEQDRQNESSVPPKYCGEIVNSRLASRSRKMPIPFFSRPTGIIFENSQQSFGLFSSEPNFNAQSQGIAAVSEDTEVIPPLPPLPPAEWRLLKLQVGPFSSGKTARPLGLAPPNPFTAFATIEKNPLQDLQVQEIESENQYALSVQAESKMPGYVSSSLEKEMTHNLNRQAHIYDESHYHDILQMEGTIVNPFLVSSTDDSNSLYGYEAYGEVSMQPPNPFSEVGHQSTSNLELSYDESWRALNSSHLTLGFEKAISKLNQIQPSLEKEQSLDDFLTGNKQIRQTATPVQISTLEDEKHKFSADGPSVGGVQLPKLSTTLPSKEHKSSKHDSISSGKESSSTLEDNSAPMLETEKPINKIPPIPKPPKYPLFEVISHDRIMLRKVSKMVQPSNKSMVDNRNSMLEQIRNKSFNLKPVLVRRPNVMGRPSTNLKVVAILERANAIRQAVASDDDDEDSWSDS